MHHLLLLLLLLLIVIIRYGKRVRGRLQQKGKEIDLPTTVSKQPQQCRKTLETIGNKPNKWSGSLDWPPKLAD
jgi:hypothetical protein